MRDFYPYLPNVDDPPAVYGNGGVYGWLTCIEAVSRMMRGDYNGGERIWKKMSNQMLYANDQPAKNMAFEYMNGDTGLDMGAFPFGGDGACFMIASLGASEWMRLEDGNHLLLIRSPHLQPPTSFSSSSSGMSTLEILRPLFESTSANGEGGRRFVKMVFIRMEEQEQAGSVNATVTRLKTSIINSAEWNTDLSKKNEGASRHIWVEDETECNSADEEEIEHEEGGNADIQLKRRWRTLCSSTQFAPTIIEVHAM